MSSGPFNVELHHTPDAADAAVPRGQGLAVGAEGHALNIALGHGEGLFLEPLASRRVPEHHTPAAADGRRTPRPGSCRRG